MASRWLAIAIVGLVAGAPLSAQEMAEPAFEVAEEPTSAWQRFGELRLRADRVSGLPAGREDLQRGRARGRFGLRWQGASLSLGFAAEGAVGTDHNRDNRVNNDVEQSDDLNLDQAWLRWQAGERASILLGKAPLPIELSPLLWDDDLRPLGASARWGGQFNDFDRWQLDLGAFAPDPLETHSARVAAVQFGVHFREGAPLSGGVLLGFLDYSDLDGLASAGLGRGNTLVAGRFANDYRLLDTQGYLRWRIGEKPLEARLDLVRNLDADRDRHGTRATLVYGDRFNHPGWEFGWAWQRMQRDAVLAAVTADDWWFHTAARGHMPWIGYRFDAIWSLRLAAFFETRDGLNDRTERVLLDVEARW